MATHYHPPQQVWMFFAVTYGFSWLFWILAALITRGVTFPSSLTDILSGPFSRLWPLTGSIGTHVAARVMGRRADVITPGSGLSLWLALVGHHSDWADDHLWQIDHRCDQHQRTHHRSFGHQRPALRPDRVLRHSLHQRAPARRIWLARLCLATLASALRSHQRQLDRWCGVVVMAYAGGLHSGPVYGQRHLHVQRLGHRDYSHVIPRYLDLQSHQRQHPRLPVVAHCDELVNLSGDASNAD